MTPSLDRQTLAELSRQLQHSVEDLNHYLDVLNDMNPDVLVAKLKQYTAAMSHSVQELKHFKDNLESQQLDPSTIRFQKITVGELLVELRKSLSSIATFQDMTIDLQAGKNRYKRFSADRKLVKRALETAAFGLIRQGCVRQTLTLSVDRNGTGFDFRFTELIPTKDGLLGTLQTTSLHQIAEYHHGQVRIEADTNSDRQTLILSFPLHQETSLASSV